MLKTIVIEVVVIRRWQAQITEIGMPTEAEGLKEMERIKHDWKEGQEVRILLLARKTEKSKWEDREMMTTDGKMS
jgi:hypothetical protein